MTDSMSKGEAPRLTRVAVPAHVVFRSFAAETVMLNLETGTYHGLNPTAGRMLEVLQETGVKGTAVVRLAEEYGQPPSVIERDLDELCAALAKRGLIELDAGSG